jgi:hypothetical protein
MNEENAQNALRGLRAKRKFGKGMAPAMKVSLLSQPDEAAGGSFYDVDVDLRDDSIEDILKVAKPSRKKGASGKGLSTRDTKSIRGPKKKISRSPAGDGKSPAGSAAGTKDSSKGKKQSKKRKSLTMSKGPDDKSSEEDDDAASVASGKPPKGKSKASWVQGKPSSSSSSFVLSKVPKVAAVSHKPPKKKAKAVFSYDSDASDASGSRPASMRLSVSAERQQQQQPQHAINSAAGSSKPFSSMLSPVRDDEEEDQLRKSLGRGGKSLSSGTADDGEEDDSDEFEKEKSEAAWDESLDLDEKRPSALHDYDLDHLEEDEVLRSRVAAAMGGSSSSSSSKKKSKVLGAAARKLQQQKSKTIGRRYHNAFTAKGGGKSNSDDGSNNSNSSDEEDSDDSDDIEARRRRKQNRAMLDAISSDDSDDEAALSKRMTKNAPASKSKRKSKQPVQIKRDSTTATSYSSSHSAIKAGNALALKSIKGSRKKTPRSPSNAV